MSIATVLVIVLLNMSSFRASKILVSLYALELGASQFYIGIMIAMYSLLPAVLAVQAGRLSDRLGVRVPMLAGSLGIGCGMLVPGLWPSVAALYVSAALIGASHMMYNLATQNLVGSLGGAGAHTRNFSNYALAMAVGSSVGPLAAGFSIDRIGHATSYLVFAMLPLVPALIMARARNVVAGPRGKTEEEQAVIASSLLANPALRGTLIGGAVATTGQDLFQFYMPIYCHNAGLPASAIGVVLAMSGIAAFFVRIWLPDLVKRWGPDRVFTTSLYISAGSFLLVPLFSDAWMLAAVSLMLGLSMGCAQPVTLMLIFSRAPEGRSGEALGVRVTINQVTHIVVPLMFGSLGTLFGVAPVFIVNSLILGGGGWLNRPGGMQAGKN
ncbi:MAG: MFS transporter [Burkholderiales bacterium]|nr:MFS transporter [Burkholderiales bacterium]